MLQVRPKLDFRPKKSRNQNFLGMDAKSLCSASFVSKKDLRGHISSVHEGLKPFDCTFCKKSFSRKTNMAQHIKNVHDKKKKIS